MLRIKRRETLFVPAVAASVFLMVAIALYFSMANDAFAQDVFVYPQKGQSEELIEKDKYACYTWAKNQTGFDPMEVPSATAPPPQQKAPKGGALRGAAGGALLGAAIGGIANDDPGKGAAIGAVTGGIFGGAKRQKQAQQQKQAEQQWADEQAAQYAQKRSSYNRAYAACLEGRDYTVK
jgi:hypothetical protein